MPPLACLLSKLHAAALVLSLLERNNEAEERADQKIASIYDGVERNIYAFLAATMVAIVLTSSYLTYSNRQIFEKLESLVATEPGACSAVNHRARRGACAPFPGNCTTNSDRFSRPSLPCWRARSGKACRPIRRFAPS